MTHQVQIAHIFRSDVNGVHADKFLTD